MNALADIVGGFQLGQAQQTSQRHNAFRDAVSQYGTSAPQTQNAFARAYPEQAFQMGQQNAMQGRQRRDELLANVTRSLAQMDPAEQQRVYPQVVEQLSAQGIEVGEFAQYPGPEAISAMSMLYGMPAAERTEFERLLQTIPEDQRRQAIAVKLGMAPGADAVLRSGAEPRDPIAALRARATEAGLQPGTPEYAQFMMAGGAQSGLAIDVGPDGTMSFRQGAGASQKPFTEGQSKDNVYVVRARGALEALDAVGADELASFSQRAANMDPTGLVRGAVQTDNFQVAQQAGNEFLQAILRKDTGAAITSQEQELYGQTYLPQPGDNPAVLQEKARARQRAINAIQSGMSPAQMIAVERGLQAGGRQDAPDTPPPGVDPADWEFMAPEDRALFGGSGAENPSQPPERAVDGLIQGSIEQGQPVETVQLARAFVGKDETRDAAPLAAFFKQMTGEAIDPRVTPWCAAFVNSVLRASGRDGTNSLLARSFLDFGTPVDEPQEGDIVVLWRDRPDSWKGHVGFYAGQTDDGKIRVLGGNQDNQVSEKTYPASRLLGYRRPPRIGQGA